MMMIKDGLQIGAWLVTIFGFPLTALTIWFNGRHANRSRDVAIVSNFVNRFHDKWSSDWRAIVEGSGIRDQLDKNKLYDMLNWIDWLGILIQRDVFSDPSLFLNSIEPTLRKAIGLTKDELDKDGKNCWPGVFTIANLIGLVGKDGRLK